MENKEVSTTREMRLIDEVRQLTASVVSEKNKKEIENYPNIIKDIKDAASEGKNSISFVISKFTSVTRSKLIMDGFTVIENEQPIPPMAQATCSYKTYKNWVVSW